ncbi:MAG: creatininase family protein [Halobacteriaceae archaeon]
MDHRYWKLTWPEVDAAAEQDRLVVIPVGSTEDHGHHLPLDVDQVLPGEICARAVEGREDALLFQTIPHGYLPHHMDFPGGITIGWETFVNYLIDVGVSLAHHGFPKLLFVNGHGSNHHLVQQAARQIIVQYPGVQAAMLSWWELEELRAEAERTRTAGPRAVGHAGELETSIYLYLQDEHVEMDEAVEDVSYPENPHFYTTSLDGQRAEDTSTPVSMMEWWSTVSETGVKGDATAATPEKGERLLAAAVAGLEAVLDGFADYPHREVEDHHSRAVGDDEYDPFRPR